MLRCYFKYCEAVFWLEAHRENEHVISRSLILKYSAKERNSILLELCDNEQSLCGKSLIL